MEYFERVTPESVGIRSEGILAFLDDIERKGLELHSLMILRHGKCCTAGWWAPYGPDYPHPLFSFSKSLTATAIGFAEQEGILSLSERLADLFPEALPNNPSDNLKEATIHHLLCMSCGHETESPDRGPDWIRSFFSHPFLHKPGEFFRYNTVGTNLLAAILKRKTGQDVTEFLQPRLFAPLGISNIFSYHLPDPDSVGMGGSGMKLTTEDMARFAYFMLQKGKWEGQQLLNESWFERAASRQMETAGDSEGHVKEWANGYGYQCWMCSLPGSFRADGAYGQFGFAYPTLDMCVITTAATEQTQSMVDSMMEHLIPAVINNAVLSKTADRSADPETLARTAFSETSDRFTLSKSPNEGARSETAGKAVKPEFSSGASEFGTFGETAFSRTLSGTALRDTVHTAALQSLLKRLHLPALSSSRNPEMERKISSVVWTTDIDSPCSSMEVLIGGAGLYDTQDGKLSDMSFVFHENTVDWICYEDAMEINAVPQDHFDGSCPNKCSAQKKVTASLENTFTLSECQGRTYAASARWRSWSALELEVRPLDSLSGARLIFRFNEDTLTIEADDTLVAANLLGTLPRKLGPLYSCGQRTSCRA